MCGVFGFSVQKKRSADEVLAGLRDLEYRGYDSWGIAAADGPQLRVRKEVGPIRLKTLDFPPTDLAIGHTRWATHGGVTVANAHPHLSEDGRLAVVHNGIIENFQTLKDGLLSRGHQFRSETDSEVIVHLYEEAKQRSADPLSAFRAVWDQLQGLSAIVLLDLPARRLLFVRRGSPLAIGQLDDGLAIASDGAALTGLAKQVVFLEDGWLGSLSSDELQLLAADGQRLQPPWQTMSADGLSADDPRFPHRMLQEIYEQPAVLQRLAGITQAPLQRAAQLVRQGKKVWFLGCGTAYHAGLVGSSLFAASGIFAPAILANEAAEVDRFIDRDCVLIVLSQSGETIDVIEPLTRWKERGAKIISLVNSPFSTLDRMADTTLHLQAGREKAVASTKAFTAKLAALTLLAAEIGGHFPEGKRQVSSAADEAQRLLADEAWKAGIEDIARLLSPKRDLFILGRGAARTIAAEAALKVKEISYLHAEGMAAGELKHGTLALVEPGVPCILISSSAQEADTESTARELKARGGWVAGIGPRRLEVFDAFIPVADGGLAGLVGSTIAVQLLAYQLAVLRGHDPDKPRNLAKSVTVK